MPSPLPSVDSKASRLIFSQETLAAVGDSDGADYQDAEFNSNWALATIRADVAYQHGYFGQNATIAVMDDGMDLNHPDLAGKTVQPRNILNGDSNVSEGSRGAIHGTYVAMLAAGARGNSQGSFVINSNDGLQVLTKNTHGVAPAASVIPIQLRGGANPLEGIEYAVSKKAHVLNASISPAGFYYGKYGNRDGIWLTLAPHFHPLLLDSQLRRLSGHEDFVEEMGAAARAMGDDADMILVWASANEGWNSGNLHTGICGKNFREEDGCNLNLDDLPVTKQELMENFVYYPDPHDASITISFKDMWGTGCGEENCIEYDVPNPWGLAPLLYPNLLGRLLVVGAVGQDGHYSAFSNGCGVARNWCLTAPGANFRIFENEKAVIQGTSFAAPIASGALAVLKSRLPSMPMEVVQAVLLVSADPMGERISNPDSPDSTYGWGIVNLGRAISMQGTVRIARPTLASPSSSALSPEKSRMKLAPAFVHLQESLQDVQLAVGGVRGAYYNMQMADLVDVQAAPEQPVRPDSAARDMLAEHRDHRLARHEVRLGPGRRARFSVDRQGGQLRGFGIDFSAGPAGAWRIEQRGCADCIGTWAREAEVFDLANSGPGAPFFAGRGTSFGVEMRTGSLRPFFAVSGGSSGQRPWRQAGMQWQGGGYGLNLAVEVSRIDERGSLWGSDFSAFGGGGARTLQKRLLLSSFLGGNWRGFVDYRHSAAALPAAAGSLVEFSGLRADRWSMGIKGHGLFAAGDELRFSIRRQDAVRGRMRVRHVVATGGSFVDAFYRGHSQHLEKRQTAIDLGRPAATEFRLGYVVPLRTGFRLALGLEHGRQSQGTGVGLRWQKHF